MMRYYCITDVGLVRKNNQDSYLCLENEANDLLALVCDGIGGSLAGEVASGEVIKTFYNAFKAIDSFDSLKEAADFLLKTTQKANHHVYKLAKDNIQYHGMGTTITGILLTKYGNLSINVGDSRVYGIDQKMNLLTDDHTLVNEMLKRGEISYLESLNHPKRHFLTAAVGIFDYIVPDIKEQAVYDYYLVCSDGLHGFVKEDKILKTVLNTSDVESKVKELCNAALLEGGYDNITIVLVKQHV